MNSIRVASIYDSKKYLERLPAEFKVVKVDSQSIKATVWRRLVQELNKQFKLPNALFGRDADTEDFTDHLVDMLKAQGFETDDLKTTLIVIGNKSGTISGRIFNQANYECLITDLKYFDPDYPIFIDTSASRFLFTENEPVEYVKRERLEDTFQTDENPPSKKINPETIEDLMAQWAEERDDFLDQIEVLKSRESKALEQNQYLIEECSKREEELSAAVEECSKTKNYSDRIIARYEDDIARYEDEIRQLKTEPMESMLEVGAEEEEDEPPMQPIANEREFTTPERSVPTRSAPKRINSLFGGFFDALLDNTQGGDQGGTGPGRSYTLAKIGLQAWDPNSCSFLNYIATFEASLMGVQMTHAQAITLLFSSLPPKYAYLRSVAARSDKFDMANFYSVAKILTRLIVGGKEKIFNEFQMLQKKPKEEYLYFLEKCRNFYKYTLEDNVDIYDDPTAFKMIKAKMVKAYPSRVVSEFKRRLEGKKDLGDISAATLAMAEEYPDMADEGVNDGTDLMALRKKYEDWRKTAKCFSCGKKGHIKKNCWKRESKTPKDGRKNE